MRVFNRSGFSRRAALLGGCGLGLGLVLGGRGRAEAEIPLAGRRIAFLIGNEGSGGYETYARVFATHLARALPESSISIEVVPEADGRLAAKRIATAREGELTIGLFETALLYSEIESETATAFSVGAFNWIGKLAVDERVLVAGTASGIRSIDDLEARAEPAIFPASTIVSRSASECYVLNALLGLSIKPVPGYNGGQRALAMLSGEGQVILGSYTSQSKLIDQGAVSVILRLNEVPAPQAPTTAPLLRSLVTPERSLPVDLIEAAATLGRWIAAPPSVAPADLDALRAAFDKVVSNAEYREEMRRTELAVDPLGGAEVQKRVRALLDRKTDLQAALAEAGRCGRLRADGERTC